MASIFLSYAHEDRRCAEKLARVLESDGHSVWWDRRLDGGEEFSAEIEAALDQCDVVVVAWSKESVRSRWVRDEAAAGCDRERLVPVSIDGSQPPMGFRQLHTLDLIGWKAAKRDQRTAELLRSVEQRVQGKKIAFRETTTPPSKRRFAWASIPPLWAMAAAVALVIAAAAALFIISRQQASGPQKPTFALLPFNTTSPDPKLRELAAQTRDSIAHTFSQSGLPVRLLSSVPQDRPVADFLIGGDFSRNGDKVLATIRLDEAAHSVTVFSNQFEAVPEDTPNLPERIGVQLAGTFNWGYPLRLLDRRHPIDPSYLADLLTSKGDTLGEYQIRKRVAAKLPNVAVAQLGVAFYTSFVLGQLPNAERAEAVAEGRRAAARVLELDPDYGEAYATWCLLHSDTRLIECENRLRAGRRIDPDTMVLNRHLGWLLRNVGRFDEAVQLLALSRARDPYNSGRIGDMLHVLEYTGDENGARELYQKGVRWFPESKSDFAFSRIWGLVDRGYLNALPRLEREIGPGILPPEFLKGSALLALLNARAIPAAKQICLSTKGDSKILCMILLSRLGDQDDAYAIADEVYPRRVGRSPAETEQIWLDDPDSAGPLQFITSPAAAPMRRDPRYLQLAQRVGLLDYWRSGRPPDFCRKQPEPICARLLNGKR